MTQAQDPVNETQFFQDKLVAYQQLINDDIAQYAQATRRRTQERYGEYALVETDAFLRILQRGGKRIRGALVIAGYEMSGGTDQAMIVQVARTIEMVHAYWLIIDDIQDRSTIRRGGPSAHVQLAEYHKTNKCAQDASHFGVAVALNAASSGVHAAQMVLANVAADEDLRLKAISILNRTMSVTAHGQTQDIMNGVLPKATLADVDRVLEWKTAHYSVLNPLHVGMVMAGADCHATDAITEYAVHAGKAFQITDDILGIFGKESAVGKSPIDDIREGKRTVLTVYALEHAQRDDKDFLTRMLGNPALSNAQFTRCQKVISSSGAYDYAVQLASQHVNAALEALSPHKHRWQSEGVDFLRGFVGYLPNRTS